MSKPEDLFHALAETMPGVKASSMFGKPCLKSGTKAFACFFEGEMAFKLGGSAHADALSTSGARLFDPSRKGRPMKQWVQIPAAHSGTWEHFAALACKQLSE